VSKPLLIIPPLTQLNTPYPATAYLTGFLKQQGFDSRQKDLGLDMVLEVFSKKGFELLFNAIEKSDFNLNNQLDALVQNRKAYENTVDAVISFLQNKNYTLGYRIASGAYLPEGSRFQQIKDDQVVKILEIILRDEVGHVLIGNQWFNFLCAKENLSPIKAYKELARTYCAPTLRGPFNLEARKQAGFTAQELSLLGG
jgi:hypothetical protein